MQSHTYKFLDAADRKAVSTVAVVQRVHVACVQIQITSPIGLTPISRSRPAIPVRTDVIECT